MTSSAGRTTRPGAVVAVVILAFIVDMFLYGAIVPLVPDLPAVAGSPGAAGALFAAYAVAMLVATPLIGRWVDHVGPRTPMLGGLVGLAIATVGFALGVDLTGTVGLIVLMIARAAQGVAAAATWTAGLALIAVTHPPERRGPVMGLALAAAAVGILLGPAVSGFLADTIGLRAPFLLIALLAAADAVARIVWIKTTAAVPSPTPMRALLLGPSVGLLVALTAVSAAVEAFPEPVLPLHLAGLGIGASGIGAAFAAAALGGGLAAWLAGLVTERFGPSRVAAVGALVAAAGFVLCGTPSAAASISGVVLVGVGSQVMLASTLVLIGTLAEHVQPPAYGAAYALYNIAYTAGLAVAPLAAGFASSLAGFPAATAGAGVFSAAVAVVLLVRGRSAEPTPTV